jgi:hypothetical protein
MGDGIRERGLKRIGMGLSSGAEKIPHIFVKYSALDPDPDPHGSTLVLVSWIHAANLGPIGSECLKPARELIVNIYFSRI